MCEGQMNGAKLVEAVQGSLGNEAATTALAEGRAMGLEQAIAHARAAEEVAPTPAGLQR